MATHLRFNPLDGHLGYRASNGHLAHGCPPQWYNIKWCLTGEVVSEVGVRREDVTSCDSVIQWVGSCFQLVETCTEPLFVIPVSDFSEVTGCDDALCPTEEEPCPCPDSPESFYYTVYLVGLIFGGCVSDPSVSVDSKKLTGDLNYERHCIAILDPSDTTTATAHRYLGVSDDCTGSPPFNSTAIRYNLEAGINPYRRLNVFSIGGSAQAQIFVSDYLINANECPKINILPNLATDYSWLNILTGGATSSNIAHSGYAIAVKCCDEGI